MKTLAILAVLCLALTGCQKPSPQLNSPRKKEQAEYDCRKHALDKVCEVPWKDKIVLYCYAKPIPRVVRDRDECM